VSIHRSFRSANRLEKHRNVLSKQERIEKLESLQKWDSNSDSIFGIPKVKNIKPKSRKKEKAEEEPEAAAVAGEGSVDTEKEV